MTSICNLSPSLFSVYKAFPTIFYVYHLQFPSAVQISDSQSFSGRQLCLPGDADWMEQSLRPQHLTLEGTLSLDLSREQPKKWFSPPSLHSRHAAGQIKTSKLQNPHRCLICSLEGKKKNQAPYFHKASGNQYWLAIV